MTTCSMPATQSRIANMLNCIRNFKLPNWFKILVTTFKQTFSLSVWKDIEVGEGNSNFYDYLKAFVFLLSISSILLILTGFSSHIKYLMLLLPCYYFVYRMHGGAHANLFLHLQVASIIHSSTIFIAPNSALVTTGFIFCISVTAKSFTMYLQGLFK